MTKLLKDTYNQLLTNVIFFKKCLNQSNFITLYKKEVGSYR